MSETRAKAQKVLELSVHFPPNVGGVETHLSDLIKLLSNKGWSVFVLCYRPLSVDVNWKIYEKYQNVEIFRIPWIKGLFYKFIPKPKLEFLYLFPGLFIFTPVVLLIKNPKIIHAHGIVAGFVGVFWGKIFNKKVIISTHSVYSFPKAGLYLIFAKFIFTLADKILCLSNKSLNEIKQLGVDDKKITEFTYWIDLDKFSKKDSKDIATWKEKFIVLFVGRLILEKGIDILLKSTKNWNKNIGLVFVGVGPLENKIINEVKKNPRIYFLGKIDQNQLPFIYSKANLLIVPSISEEGFGRVIMESLACSTPVIGSNKGAIPEAMDETVGKLIEISPQSIKDTISDFYLHSDKLLVLSRNARKFAERRYSDKNANTIIKAYTS